MTAAITATIAIAPAMAMSAMVVPLLIPPALEVDEPAASLNARLLGVSAT
jgi:hypothetical protein